MTIPADFWSDTSVKFKVKHYFNHGHSLDSCGQITFSPHVTYQLEKRQSGHRGVTRNF